MKDKQDFSKIYCFFGVFLLGLLLCTVFVVWVDPYFHFHPPVQGISYHLGNERYINDGIGRHMEYDAVITGTSMTENFKTTLFDELFDANAVKVPYSGGAYKEISESLQRMISRNEHVSQVLWGLDYNMLGNDKDYSLYEQMPDYLYDDSWQNDVSYILNKDTCLYVAQDLLRTILGMPSTTMDEYACWTNVPGKAAVLSNYERGQAGQNADRGLTAEESRVTLDSIRQNLVPVIEENPDITFYLFIPPYSIVYWDGLSQNGEIEKQIGREKILLDSLINYPNVQMFCFFENTDLICNLDNYKDPGHYLSQINEEILKWIKAGDYRITEENVKQHLSDELDFFLNYDYDALFEE